MKTIVATCLFLLCGFIAKSQSDANSDSTEPKTELTVTINGKTYSMAESDSLQLDGTFTKPTIAIRASGYKKFDKAAMSFEYPKNLSFQFQRDFGLKTWTLSGNDFVIIVFEMDAQVTLNDLTDEMIKKFGKQNCVVTDEKKELGGRLCDVKQMTISLAGTTLLVECYTIKTDDYKSHFVYFQDSFEGNKHSEEYEKGFGKVASTIRFK